MKVKLIKKSLLVCLTFIMIFSPHAAVFANSGLDYENHWAKLQITDWMDKGLIKGYPDGSFQPNRNISRAEFMALVNRAYEAYIKQCATIDELKREVKEYMTNHNQHRYQWDLKDDPCSIQRSSP
ncbi:S-layer homology domain-containing protein [Anaerobacillus alkaliphilus]|uniref:S-layer homology domain-containing protein n=1 Tax=Anaerobacillus alkaliphilus TaxID=1548597 RepID=A0A4V1LGM0_9BACI|nr:S-layer homology domain-containing protein [Anaerobacillus alkaliphilus]